MLGKQNILYASNGDWKNHLPANCVSCRTHFRWMEICLIKGATKFYFTHYSWLLIILFNSGVFKSTFYLFFWKTSFFCLSAFFVFSAFSKFGVIFMNICNIYIIIRCQVLWIFFWLITFQLNNLWEHKILIRALTEKAYLQGAFEF